MSLGKTLKNLRERQKLSRREVAAFLGHKNNNGQFLFNIEKGSCFPPIKDLPKLAKLYSVNTSDLFEEMLQNKLQVQSAKLRAQFNKLKK